MLLYLGFSQNHPIRRSSRKAFTLIELLMVVAIIGILVGLLFSGAHTIIQSARERTARAEMVALKAALDNYRERYGTYPESFSADDPEAGAGVLYTELFFRFDAAGQPPILPYNAVGTSTPDTEIEANDFYTDPWGQPYQYYFRRSDDWRPFGFVLYSMGRLGQHEPPTPEGVWDYDASRNSQVIYLD